MSYSTLIRSLRPITAKFGVASTVDLWQGMALRQYKKKVETNLAYRQWLARHADRWIADHWGHYKEKENFCLAHVSSQLFEITEMLHRRIGPIGGQSVLDAGASDGMFLSLLRVKNGVGVNFLPACVEKIRSDGYPAYACDIEHMPFENKQFDIVICCETLEHVLNPLRTLNELARVCRQKIYLTIPWLPDTRINARPDGWPETESHIFEFCPKDFNKIVTFSDVQIVHSDFIHVFPEPQNPISQWCLRRWMYPNFFPKLQYYELEPTS